MANTMDYTFLGNTGLRVSRLGFGTMTFGADASKTAAAKMFARCRDVGVNLFDTADVYAHGKGEEILGQLIAPCRDEVVLCTKAYFPTGDDPNARGGGRYHLIRAVEASLRRLGTDRIDLFYLHRYDDYTPLPDTLYTLELLVRQGKILYPAVSNFSAWQTAKALEIGRAQSWAPIACTQPMYNLVKRQAEVEILPHAAAEKLGVLCYGPLGGGLLSGKYGVGIQPGQGRLVDNKMYAVRYSHADYWRVAEEFKSLADEVGCHPAALAIAWVAAHPAVSAPLVGARSLAQLNACLSALRVEMTDQLYQRIANLTPTPPPATDRNEETSQHNFGDR